MALYKYYQPTGGKEKWEVTRSETDLSSIAPTFITVLSLDTLETLPEDKPSKELLQGIRYFGPMYFDLDSKDIEESIEGGQELVVKLQALGLTAGDMEIYLSGKKGLHILIDPKCFMEKLQPVQFLPGIYKEIAFKLATQTIDYAVYTARTGRLLRTCYNVRENGNYRVPITVEELLALTAETYNEFCRTPRLPTARAPEFRPQFALVYDAAKQKVSKGAARKAKPVDAAQIRLHLPIVQQIMRGEIAPGVGFNKVAIQLAIYARDANINADTLVVMSEGLLTKHSGDGNRYDTPYKREEELRRMVDYVDSNTSYEYAIGPLKAMLPRADGSSVEPVFDDEGVLIADASVMMPQQEAFTCGVSEVGHQYVASKGDAGDIAISNFIFTDVIKLVTTDTEEIVGLRVNLTGPGKVKPPLIMTTGQFTGSSSLQNAVSAHGGSFTGSDIHARGILQIMLHRVTSTRYVIDSEGVNLVKLPLADNEELREPFIVWADSLGVRTPQYVQDSGIDFDFSGYPDVLGVLKTDLTLAPTLAEYVVNGDDYKAYAIDTIKAMCNSQSHETMGKLIGWMVATFWRQQFHHLHQKFPLLHVYGPAGLGKSETTTALLKFFYYKTDPVKETVSGTPFGLSQKLGASGSIPIPLDEYKPHKMSFEKTEAYRSIMRQSYNMQEMTRGGGNRTKESYNALNKTVLSGPLIFISESPETETAILERVVLVSFKRPTPAKQNKNFMNSRKLHKGAEILSYIGHSLALGVTRDDRMAEFTASFDNLHDRAISRLMVTAEDDVRRAAGEMSEEEYAGKQMNKQRAVYNCTVALFGLLQLKKLLVNVFGDDFELNFGEEFREMGAGIFKGLQESAVNMVPEYIKLLMTMGDMTHLAVDDRTRLVEGQEYNLSEIGGRPVLVLVPRAAYSKYRKYCKDTGMEHYYANDMSFTQAIREVPQFLKTGKGTTRTQVETLVFDFEDLQRSGVSKWAGKPVNLKL